MKSENPLQNFDIQFFKNGIISVLQDNLNITIISTLSNMLALDHTLRAPEMNNLPKEIYLETAIRRLKIYLSGKYIQEKDFATSMHLFIVAISKEDIYTENKDMLAEYIIENVTDTNKENKIKAQELITSALEADQQEVFDMINTQPEKLSQILCKVTNSIELISEIKKENFDHKIANLEASETKSLFSLIGSGVVAAIGVAAASVLGGIAPFIIIPAAICSLKIGAEAGERALENIQNNPQQFATFNKVIDKISTSIQKTIEIARAPSKEQKTEVTVEKKDLQQVNQIMSEMSAHLTNEVSKTPKAEIIAKTAEQERTGQGRG
jgi:hypothetical protein